MTALVMEVGFSNLIKNSCKLNWNNSGPIQIHNLSEIEIWKHFLEKSTDFVCSIIATQCTTHTPGRRTDTVNNSYQASQQTTE